MKIVFPESKNPTIQAALNLYQERIKKGGLNYLNGQPLEPVEAVRASDLTEACALINSGAADSLIAGVDYSSRDVILACRDAFGMGNFAADLDVKDPEIALQDLGVPISTTSYTTFSGLAVMKKSNTENQTNKSENALATPDDSSPKTYLLADMAACKNPTATQLTEIIEQTYASARAILKDEPKIALLSFSTNGSGGKDSSIDLWREVLAEFNNSNIEIDGEMQLDAAINPLVGQKKFPGSPVAGYANVLVAPDLNSGNLLYKCFEQIAGYSVAGPILQGFSRPISDLSRGSTVEDVMLTIEAITCLSQRQNL